jgi:tetratricopeptide (TPR) repeat protein
MVNSVSSNTPSACCGVVYLKGRYYWNKRTVEGFAKAVNFFNQALEKDPTYALAYVGLANCYLIGTFNYIDTYPKRVAMVQAAMEKALEIDDTLGEAYAVLAINKCFYEWDFVNAEREYKRAIELSPNYATAHHWYAEFLAMEGRFDESFAEYNRALELDPLSLAINTDLGLTYYYSRQSDLAINHLKKLKEIDSNYARTYLYLGQIYKGENMFEDSITAYNSYSTLSGDNLAMGDDLQVSIKRREILGDAFKISGVKGYWKKSLEFALENESFDTVQMAIIYAQLGERDRAFEFLEKAYNERSTVLLWLKVSPEFDSLRSDPRFDDLMRRVGLPL